MLRAFGVILGTALFFGAALLLAIRLYDQPGPLTDQTAVLVPRAPLDQVADVLAARGVVSNPTALRLAALVTRGQGPIRAAELAFPKGASLRQVLVVLRFGKPVQHRVTIPEGSTAAQVSLLLDRAPALEGDSVVPEEGTVLPETYSFELGMTRAGLLERGTKAMDRALERAWATRAADTAADQRPRCAGAGEHRGAGDQPRRRTAAGGAGVPQSPAPGHETAIRSNRGLRRKRRPRRA